MILAIVGTRNPGVTYKEWEKLLLNKINPDEIQMIISGGAKGVDTFAKLFAVRHNKPYMEFALQYNVYGRYATLKRNTQIVKEATTVNAFPSAESKGTYHSIKDGATSRSACHSRNSLKILWCLEKWDTTLLISHRNYGRTI